MDSQATDDPIPSSPLFSTSTNPVHLTRDASDLRCVLARVADGCALLVIGIGLLTMAGWLFGIDLLTRVLPHLESMKFNTALCFVLSGAALWWRERPAVRIGLGVPVALIGALTLTEYLSGRDLGIDQLFVRAVAEGQRPLWRMSQATALCFLLSGAALGLMRSQRLAEAMALGAAVIGGFALLGYALGSEQLYHVPGFVSMAVHTAAAFVFLVAGILCALPQGMVALLLRSSRTGRALWLGLGVLTAFLGATGVISVYLQGSLKTGVKKQGEFNLPRSATVNEIEINIIEYALAVRKHINGEPNARATAANEALEVAHHAAVYERLAENAVQRELAARFAVLWREFHALGEALMEARPPGREELARFGAIDRRLDQFLDEVMQPDALAVFEAGRAINVRSVHNTELLTVILLLAGVVLALLTSSAVARTVLGGEAALRESEERLRQLLRVLPVAVYTCDADGSITFFNNRAIELWGRRPRLGNPEDRFDGAVGLSWPDGLPLPREESPMAKAIRNGRSIRNQEMAIERPDGSRAHVVMNIDPIRAQDGSIIGAINAFADYSELRRAEAEIATQSRDLTELKRAEAKITAKSRDLETLLNVTSHDLREPLRAIENFSRLIQERYADRMDEKGQDFLQRIIRGAKRLDQLLLDILAVSRAQRLEVPLEEVSSEDIVRDVLGRLETRIQETGAKVRVQEGLPRLQVDRTWATQAVYNLVVNALKFTRHSQPPEVEIAPYVEGSKAIGIVVCDRGPGVPPEQRERIFQLFQRAVGREVAGTGAGLAIVKQVAQRHGGDAWVEPRAGGGSVFVITFAKMEREGVPRWTANA